VIVGVGIDLIVDSDFQKRIERSPSLLATLLRLSYEIDANSQLANRNENADNAKTDIQQAKSNLVSIEAIFKALPGSLRTELGNLRISRDEQGRPHVVSLGHNKEELSKLKFHLSISHDSGVTIGIVIIESITVGIALCD
jgi:phosphopantetheinyl transferase (holo-ACP synthase)